MGILLVGPEERARIERLVAFATVNPLSSEFVQRLAEGYDPQRPSTRKRAPFIVPLDYTMDLPAGVRLTFTLEEQPPGLCRHLSVSLLASDELPNPEVLRLLMPVFGFTRPLEVCRVWTEAYAAGFSAANVMEPVA